MTLDPETLHEITRTVWSALLDVDLREVDPHTAIAEPAFTGLVRIEGEFCVAVAVTCSEATTRRLAAHLLVREPAELTEADLVDAIGELANVCGGNAKALIRGARTLSLPIVARTPAPETLLAGASATTRVVLADAHEPLAVTALALG